MGYMETKPTPYGCPSMYCSAVSFIKATAMGDDETIWCIVACSIGHEHVRRLNDLREVTNHYWPTKDH